MDVIKALRLRKPLQPPCRRKAKGNIFHIGARLCTGGGLQF